MKLDHLLDGLVLEPELGYAVYATMEGTLHAFVIAPRECVQQRSDYESLLRRHPEASVWVAPLWTYRTGKVWHGSGWFPVKPDEWSRMCDDNSQHQHMFLTKYSKLNKRQRNLLTGLEKGLNVLS